ncbi:MAG: DNA primase [Patescibacteria group bacterium]
MSDTVQEIREKVDIADFLKGYLRLSPAGKNFKANCPFHQEKTPSFIISPEKQIWHCFGCGAGGDIVGFLMRYENIEFIEALKILAEKAGIDFRRQGTADQKQYARFYEINEAAKNFFKLQLAASDSVKTYLKERGLKLETIEEFELGFAPDGRDVLVSHLTKRGYSINDIEKAGVIIKSDRGTYYDRFRRRIMFPIYNHFGKVIGFTGRVMPSDDATLAKYVNSPETPIFNKSKILYGLHKTKNQIRESSQAFLVEGQMDFLMCWQAGINNVIATSGTALTGEHLKILKRLAGTLILAFDADEAGQLAAERTIDMAGALDFAVNVFGIDDKRFKDPADVAQNNPELLKKYLSEAKPAMRHLFEKYLTNSDVPNLANQKRGIRVLLAKIKNLHSPVERAQWIKELSVRTGIGESAMLEEMDALESAVHLSPQNNGTNDEQKVFINKSRKDVIAQRLLSLVSADARFLPEAKLVSDFLPEAYKQVLAVMESSSSPAAKEIADLAVLVNLRSSLELQRPSEKMGEEFKDLLKQLESEHLKERREILGTTIKNAEEKGDEKAITDALKEFDFISKKLQNI